MIAEIPGSLTVRGRTFSRDEILAIRRIVEASPGEHRKAISRMVCEALSWRQINGRLKDRSCRDVLLRLHELQLICLPPRRRTPARRRPISITSSTDPRSPIAFAPREIDAECISVITRSGRKNAEKLWNEYVERYHYLRYGVPVGPHIKYFVHLRGELIACLAFAGAAWKVAPRDAWIGWSMAQRKANLYFIVNNTRFLILPWIQVPNLASRLLSLIARRLPDDWFQLYAYRPLLMETFVHAERHTGACYKAANWLCVGTTQGRGKMDRYGKADLPKKLVFLAELAKGARERLIAMSDNHDP